ncbi:glycosyltransferase [Exilibacterium tricleocarpae]|uniref:Glycosyltransferase n=1 Tax=Exilibacterium tricleocarpae TaxID=2591008 RepID=A0A545SZY2_9GAMM|nr:glycosyltransferase [Exilibacterium tricleocarpae]TQV70536.1 glycosyltransferase [Exilibacterium tricleocarpae]
MRRVICLNQDAGIGPARAKGAAVHLNAMRDAFRLIGAEVMEIDCADREEVAQRIKKLCAAKKVDLIYERYALGQHTGAQIATALKIPLILEVNAPLADEQKQWRKQAASAEDSDNDAVLFNAATAVIAVSNPVAGYAKRRGAPKECIHVFGNGIDSERFNLAMREKSVRSRLKLDEHFVIGFHGRERPWHGFKRLVQAYTGLHGDNLPRQLLVVGEGKFADLKSLPPSKYQRFGWQPHSKMPEYVAAFDALPLAYTEDIPYYFSPLKLMEAMACGVVPVVPDLGDLARTVSHNETGLVYAPDDAAALAQHLQWLIDNPQEKALMSERAATYASQFTWERIARFALGFAKKTAPRAPRVAASGKAGKSAMQRALRELEKRNAIKTSDQALVRVDVGKDTTLDFEAVNGRESRWFRYRNNHLEELFPGADNRVPLAKSLKFTGSTQWRLLSYRPGRRLVILHRDADHSAVIKGYRQHKLAAAITRHQLARRLFAGTHLQVPALLHGDVPEASMVTAYHSGVTLPVSGDHEHLYTLIGQSLRRVQDTSAVAPADLHTAGDELENLSRRAHRFRAATGALPPGWESAWQRLQTMLGSLPANHCAAAHRDLHDRQFIVNGEELTLLDFDLLCRADVTLDVANLLAHLSLRALQKIDNATFADAHTCGRALLDGLERYTEAGFWPRLRFYQAATFLRLALIYALRPQWADLSGHLLSLGDRCLNDYDRLGA